MKPTGPESPASRSADGAAHILSPLRHRYFRALWIANLFSNVGTWVQTVGAAWLMTTLEPSPDWVASVQAASTLPMLLVAVPAGAVADLWDRRRVMLATQTWMLTVAILLATLQFMGAMTPSLLLAITFALGLGTAFNSPAWQASVNDVVPRSDLPAAITLNAAAFNLARAAGPALGGLIVASAGPGAAFLFNAVSFAALIVALLLWRKPAESRRLPRERLVDAMFAGIRYAADTPGIRAVLVRAGAFGILTSAAWALLPLVARDLLGGGPVTYGILLGAVGVGAVGSAGVLLRLRRRLGAERLIVLSTASFVVMTAVLAMVPVFWVLLPFLALGGLGWLGTLSTYNITVQTAAPGWVKARALSIYAATAFGFLAVGSWVWGHVATALGLQEALLLAASFGLASLALPIRYRLPAVERLDLSPADPLPDVKVALEFPPERGPVLVTVDYDIPPEKQSEFTAAMRHVRRFRRRNGSAGWSLYQDVVEPRHWVETFTVPSWVEFLRVRDRRTVDDVAAFQRARACHAGEAPPRVTRLLLQAPGHRLAPGGAPDDAERS